eukprot:7195865-Pyramimonas_sp.AAC.1
MPFVVGSMTRNSLNALLARHKGRVKFVQEDQFSKRVPDMETVNSEDVYSEGRASRTYPWGIQYVGANVVRGRGAG